MERDMPTKVPLRSKLDKKFTWNAESVFPSDEAWEQELKQITEDIDSVKQFQGRLTEGPSVLLEALACAHQLFLRAQKIFMYAGFAYAVDTTDQDRKSTRLN